MNKNVLIIGSFLLCVIGFILPFYLKKEQGSILDVLLAAFAITASIATIITLIIAIFLYDRFKVDSLIVERQTNKVLELVDYLKGKQITFKIPDFTFWSRFDIDKPEIIKDSHYSKLAGYEIIIRQEDYQNFVAPFLKISKSYWLPEEIKREMDFLEIVGLLKRVKKKEFDHYAMMSFGESIRKTDKWYTILSRDLDTSKLEDRVARDEFLVNDYIASKNRLINAIQEWLSKQSNRSIKLDMVIPG